MDCMRCLLFALCATFVISEVLSVNCARAHSFLGRWLPIKNERQTPFDCPQHSDSVVSLDNRILSHAERVKKAKQLLVDAKKFPKGCSEFVSEVLGIDWKDANAIMGADPNESIGRAPYDTSGLTPGDIVGWYKNQGSGHVAVFIGEPGCKFIDVKEPNATSPLAPRKVTQYEKERELFKSRNY